MSGIIVSRFSYPVISGLLRGGELRRIWHGDGAQGIFCPHITQHFVLDYRMMRLQHIEDGSIQNPVLLEKIDFEPDSDSDKSSLINWHSSILHPFISPIEEQFSDEGDDEKRGDGRADPFHVPD